MAEATRQQERTTLTSPIAAYQRFGRAVRGRCGAPRRCHHAGGTHRRPVGGRDTNEDDEGKVYTLVIIEADLSYLGAAENPRQITAGMQATV